MDKKWLTKVIVLSLAVISLALLTIFLPQRQILQQRAYFGNVNLRINPPTMTKLINQEFNVDINIEAGSYKVSAVDLIFNYDQSKMQITDFVFNPQAFNSLLIRDLGQGTGNARLVVLSFPNGANLPTGSFTIGTLTLKGIVGGSTPVGLVLDRANSLISGENPDPESLDTALQMENVTDGSYTFTPQGVGTPIPTTSLMPSPTTTIIPSVTPGPTSTPQPTTTPLPTPTGTVVPTPTVTTSPEEVTLSFSVKYQGIDQKRVDQVVEVWIKKGSFSKVFTGVNTQANDEGVYRGSVVLADVPAGSGYAIFIKGPRHLAKKFCVDNQTRFCASGIAGQITLSLGDNSFDFSGLRLEAGDLPNPNDSNQQDGVANSVDYSLVTNRWFSTEPINFAIADLNLDGIINAFDSNMVRQTIETRYEDQE